MPTRQKKTPQGAEAHPLGRARAPAPLTPPEAASGRPTGDGAVRVYLRARASSTLSTSWRGRRGSPLRAFSPGLSGLRQLPGRTDASTAPRGWHRPAAATPRRLIRSRLVDSAGSCGRPWRNTTDIGGPGTPGSRRPGARWCSPPRSADPRSAPRALERLAASYWRPVYKYLRAALAAPARGRGGPDAGLLRPRRWRRGSSTATTRRGRASAPSCAPASTASSPTSGKAARRLKRGGGVRRALPRLRGRRGRAARQRRARGRPRPGGVLPPRVGARACSPARWRRLRARCDGRTASARTSRSSSATTWKAPTPASGRPTPRWPRELGAAGHAGDEPPAPARREFRAPGARRRCASSPAATRSSAPRRARSWGVDPR